MNSHLCLSSTEKLLGWLNKESLEGYDPYDGLSAPLGSAIDRISPFLGRVFIHALKNLPLNIRPLLGVKKELDAKALGLLARGYFLLGTIFKREDLLAQGKSCIGNLLKTANDVYSGISWGHPFPYRSSRLFLPPDSPSVVSTVYAAQAFLDAFVLFEDSDYLEVAISTCRFIGKDLARIGDEDSFLFSYIPEKKLAIHNASLLAAGFLARCDALGNSDDHRGMVESSLNYTLADQNDDGSWFYDALEFSSSEDSFIDCFHTGFVLESLIDIFDHTGLDCIRAPLDHGLRFYADNLFRKDGKPIHLFGRPAPVDLRDCAQGMIVLCKAIRTLDYEGQKLLDKLVVWTVQNMQNTNGTFRFLHRRLFAPRIPYMRFQGWILHALAHALALCADCRTSE